MSTNPVRNRRVGLVILITAAIIATVLLVPGVALGLETTFSLPKTVFKVGETVTFNASVKFNASPEEVAKIQSVTLNVHPASGSTQPGSEAFEVNLPTSIGQNIDITNRLPQGLQDRGSTLEVDINWVDLGPAPGGYSYGYKGASTNARIDYVIRWTPAVKRVPPPPAESSITSPVVAFPNPVQGEEGGGGGGAGTLDVNLQYEVPTIPEAPEEAEVLGLAFDRFNNRLLVLMNNPAQGGNDQILELDPFGGFIWSVIDTGRPDTQDVAWLSDPNTDPKFPMQPGSTWIAYQDGNNRKVQRIVPSGGPTYNVPADSAPLKGLGAMSQKDPQQNQFLLPSLLQTDPGLGIQIPMIVASSGNAPSTMVVPAGPTGGGYNDVVVDDAESTGGITGLGAFGSKLGQFDIPGGFFISQADVKSGGEPLQNIVGLALDSNGNLFLATYASQGKIYVASISGGLGGGGGGPSGGPVFARAITNNPSGNIFMLMDGTGSGGQDEVVTVNESGDELNRFIITCSPGCQPSSNLESLAFLSGFLYTVDNGAFPHKLYKVDPATGNTASGYPKNLPDFVNDIGDLTLNAGGNKLIGVDRFATFGGSGVTINLYFIDPANGAVTSSTTLKPQPPAFVPDGLEGLTMVTGAPGSPFLLATKFQTLFFINPTNGNVFDTKNVTTFPPFGMTGLTQRGTSIYATDDSQQVFKGGLPGAAAPEDTSAGDYEATFSVTLNPTTPPPPITKSFTIERVDQLTITISQPQDGAAFTTTSITMKGTVNDPTVKTVTMGINLATTALLGPHGFENGNGGLTLTGLWHRTNTFNPNAFNGKPRAIGQWSMAYTQDSNNGFPGIYNYNNGAPNSGTATSDSFTVGSNTTLSFWTWYFTEPNEQFDRKVIRIVPVVNSVPQAPQTLAQIVSFPPMVNGVPQFNAQPGTVFNNPGIPNLPTKLIFIPNQFVNGFGGDPQLVQVDLSLDDFIGQNVQVQFFFDTVDAGVNGPPEEGWFVDNLTVAGAGAGTGKTVTVGEFAQGVPFEIAEGSNTITVKATRNAYGPVLNAQKSVTVSLDNIRPIIRLLSTEDLNGNHALDSSVTIDLGTFNEDITGDSALTVLPSVTNNAVQTIFGIYKEDNPVLLTVELNGKLVLSKKSFDATKRKFSTTVSLASGTNTIVVSMQDAGGLTPNASDPLNTLSLNVILDNTGPTLTPKSTIYPFTAIAGTPGDPVVYQVTATDAETGISKVEILSSPAKNMLAMAGTPQVLRDQWGTTGNYLFPTVIPSGATPGTLSLTVKATDLAGNVTTAVVTANVTAAMTAWNSCLQQGGNLMSLPIQPTNGTISSLLSQKVANVNSAFKATLLPKGTDPSGDASKELDADGDVTMANVISSIQYWPGGVSGGGVSFAVYTPSLAADTLTTLQEGKAYWAFLKPEAFKAADPLPGFTASSYSCMTLTTAGQFLTPGSVPPVFPVLAGWNMVGPHTEEDKNVGKFLTGVTFPTRTWTSLLAFLNGVFFDYQNAGDEAVSDRVTQKLGAFESRGTDTDSVQRGEGFWLFVVTNGNITP